MTGVDVGSANERTALAWQRTALSLMAGAAVVARLTISELGLFALVSLPLALGLSVWVFAESRWRYAQHRDKLHGGNPRRSHARGGRAPAFLVLATVLIAITELAAIVRPG
jgi:uncharacterized membrane protein YidH (DUF202 family)